MIISRLYKTIAFVLIISLIQIVVPRYSCAFSVGEEREVGEKLLYAVRAAFPIVGEPDIHQYINSLGSEVLAVAGVQYFDYRFYIVESDQFNAFAAPSGLIFFYTKLIESMNNEDELVSVLAHEIGHVVKRHLASRMQKGKIVNFASLGLALAAIAFGGGGAATQALLTGSLAAGQSAQLHFSREDEIEADLMAYKWINDLHRDPYGQKGMLKTMRRITRYRMGQVPQYLLTHPNPEARLDYVEGLLAADNSLPVERTVENDFSFLRFKYRLMSIVKNNKAARAYLVSKMSDSRSSDFDVTMARYGLSQLDRKENNLERALTQLDKVIEKLPGKQILNVDRAILLAEMGLVEQAKTILKNEVSNDPFDMYGTFHLAELLDKTGDTEKALQLFFDVSYEMPEYSAVYFKIGRIMAQLGRELESRFYLGKYNLYEGQLKLATSNFKQISKSNQAGQQLRDESEKLLSLIERLKE
jgi:predicted Zn-dependent protease